MALLLLVVICCSLARCRHTYNRNWETASGTLGAPRLVVVILAVLGSIPCTAGSTRQWLIGDPSTSIAVRLSSTRQLSLLRKIQPLNHHQIHSRERVDGESLHIHVTN